VKLAAESVTAILQSKQSDDEISAELVELLGIDDIELVMELIHNRRPLVQHLTVRPFLLYSLWGLLIQK